MQMSRRHNALRVQRSDRRFLSRKIVWYVAGATALLWGVGTVAQWGVQLRVGAALHTIGVLRGAIWYTSRTPATGRILRLYAAWSPFGVTAWPSMFRKDGLSSNRTPFTVYGGGVPIWIATTASLSCLLLLRPRPSVDGMARCMECGYLQGYRSERCPECGSLW